MPALVLIFVYNTLRVSHQFHHLMMKSEVSQTAQVLLFQSNAAREAQMLKEKQKVVKPDASSFIHESNENENI